MKLQDKVAVVTGAAAGMGKAISILFAKEGAKLVITDIDKDGLQETKKEIEANGGTVTAMIMSVAEKEDTDNMIDTAVKNYGTLDILVNNAGLGEWLLCEDISDEAWDKVIAVNLTGMMRTIRKALPIFAAKESGVIVNIASIAGTMASRGGAAYTASKHGVVGLSKNVGYQYAQKGIRCNSIAPGSVQTTNVTANSKANNLFSNEGIALVHAGYGLCPRKNLPIEIAKVALFLACDDSSCVNATCITADSGWTAY